MNTEKCSRKIPSILCNHLTHIWKKTEIPTFPPPLYQNFRIRKKRQRKKELAEKLSETLKKLSERERLVIQLHYKCHSRKPLVFRL